MNAGRRTRRRVYEFCGSFRDGAGEAGFAVPSKGVWQALAETLVNTDPPHGFAGSLHPEVGDWLDAREPPPPKVTSHRLVLADDNEDSVMIDPIIGFAPEGESPRVVGVIAEHRVFTADCVSKLGALIPETGEEKGSLLCEQPMLMNLFGDLIPAIKVERRVVGGVDKAPAAVATALEESITVLGDGKGQEQDRKSGADGEISPGPARPSVQPFRPILGPEAGGEKRGQSSPNAARPAENRRRA